MTGTKQKEIRERSGVWEMTGGKIEEEKSFNDQDLEGGVKLITPS